MTNFPDLKSPNAMGAMFMCASMGGYACNDAAMKLASADQSIYQSILVRGIFAVVLLGMVAISTGALKETLSVRDRKLVGWRTFVEALSTICFLSALLNMPFANLAATLMALPLTVSLSAAYFFREPLGWRRLIAISAGFVGVALIIRPDADGFNVYSILALITVLLVTARELITRQFSTEVPSAKVAFVAAAAITLLGAASTVVTQNWVPMGWRELGLLAMAACFIFVGYLCSILAMRHGDVSVVAPFRYTTMIWAIGLGWFIWGEAMDGWATLGVVIIILAGVFTFWRERVLRNQQHHT